MEVYAVFRRPKGNSQSIEEPIGVFSSQEVADLSASRLSMASGEAYLVGRYYVLDETKAPIVPIVEATGTISFFANGVVSPDFQLVSCKRKGDGVADIRVDHVPLVYSDPYGDRVATYKWTAIVDVLETDTIDSIKKRLSRWIEEQCRSLMIIMDPFGSTTM